MIDFFAKWPHYMDHMVPIWRALRNHAGTFFIPESLEPYARHLNIDNVFTIGKGVSYPLAFSQDNPIVVAGHADLQTVYTSNQRRPIVLMEHGVGLVFPNNASYAGNIGYRKHAALTLAPNRIVYEKTKSVLPDMHQVIIGTPKLDHWAGRWGEAVPNGNVHIAISFHWDGGNVAPETGSAFDHFKRSLPLLKSQFGIKLIGHCHPRAVEKIVPVYREFGIEYEPSFENIMETADLYINDSSSTMYEFLVTGRRVIILNSPRFRRNVNFGIRFWDFTDIGHHANSGMEMFKAIEYWFQRPNEFLEARRRTVDILFPYLGHSAQIAANAIMEKFND